MQYRNYYKCTCKCEWEDVWSSMCDDRCPACNTAISPFKSEEVKMFCIEIDVVEKHYITEYYEIEASTLEEAKEIAESNRTDLNPRTRVRCIEELEAIFDENECKEIVNEEKEG